MKIKKLWAANLPVILLLGNGAVVSDLRANEFGYVQPESHSIFPEGVNEEELVNWILDQKLCYELVNVDDPNETKIIPINNPNQFEIQSYFSGWENLDVVDHYEADPNFSTVWIAILPAYESGKVQYRCEMEGKNTGEYVRLKKPNENIIVPSKTDSANPSSPVTTIYYGDPMKSVKNISIHCLSKTSKKTYQVDYDEIELEEIRYISCGKIGEDGPTVDDIKAIGARVSLPDLTTRLKAKTNRNITLLQWEEENEIQIELAAGAAYQLTDGNISILSFEKQQSSDGSEVTWRVPSSDYHIQFAESDIVPSEPSKPTKPSSSSKPLTPPTSTPSKQSYRLYNPETGEHFFTTNKAEYDLLAGSKTWKSETSTWNAPEKSDYPIYRLCNPNTDDHHYTMNAGERDALVHLGWRDEGIGMYSADQNGQPVLRLYNPNAKVGSHHYTTSTSEKDHLVSLGWKFEGIGFYGLK